VAGAAQQIAGLRLMHDGDRAPFMCTRLNLFTGLALAGILVLIILAVHLRVQVGSVETKLMYVLSTMR